MFFIIKTRHQFIFSVSGVQTWLLKYHCFVIFWWGAIFGGKEKGLVKQNLKNKKEKLVELIVNAQGFISLGMFGSGILISIECEVSVFVEYMSSNL